MAMKEWFRQLQPVRLYLILSLTTVFFLTQLVMSHMTHALTLLVDAYHMLCNIIALTGCIITIKYGSLPAEDEALVPCSTQPVACQQQEHVMLSRQGSRERRLRNTFGWARIDILVMLIGCVFLASLCFSLLVEALQTLIHIGHHDEMHHALPVLALGVIGLLLNGLCYVLIGGYTFHQASFLHITPEGNVVLEQTVTQDSLRKGQRRLSAQTRRPAPPPQNTRQGPWEMCRDVIGCVFVIICALVVHLSDENIAKYVDPALSIVSAVLLLVLSYPYMRESGLILLQTIPDTINIEYVRNELIKAFPDIINVHDLHVWRLSATKVISTVHIIFSNAKDYVRINSALNNFFLEQGITQVTIQPEFYKVDHRSSLTSLPNTEDNCCLVLCQDKGCMERLCCRQNIERETKHHQQQGNLIKNCKQLLPTFKLTDTSDKKPPVGNHCALDVGQSGIYCEIKSIQPLKSSESETVHVASDVEKAVLPSTSVETIHAEKIDIKIAIESEKKMEKNSDSAKELENNSNERTVMTIEEKSVVSGESTEVPTNTEISDSSVDEPHDL